MRRFVATLRFVFLGLCAAVGLAPAQTPPAEKPPYQRLLQGDDAKKAAELDKKIEQQQEADQYVEALQAAEELLALRRRVQGADHPEAVTARWDVEALRHLAALSAEQRAAWRAAVAGGRQSVQLARAGRLAEAFPLQQRLLELHRQILGERHPDTALWYSQLAVNLASRGQAVQAESFYRPALAIRRETLGERHPDTAVSYHNLAANLAAQGKYAEAEPLMRKALEIARLTQGGQHTRVARSANTLASILIAQGKYAEADPFLRDALAIRRQTLGERHADTCASVNNLAVNLHHQGKFAEAEALHRQALEIDRQVRGARHPETANDYENLASVLHSQGKDAEAEPLYRQALAIFQEALGAQHPATARCTNNLAANLSALRRDDEADVYYRKALELHRQALGARHPDTVQSLCNLAVHLTGQGKYAEAEPLARQSLETFRQVLGERHPWTARSYHDLAANLVAQGRYAEALPLSQAAARAYEATRLRASTSGLERAAFGEEQVSPYPLLVSNYARAGRPEEAWQALVSHFGRGLLDEATARAPQALSDSEGQQLHDLNQRLEQLGRPLLELAIQREPTAEQRSRLEQLLRERAQLEQQLIDLAVADSRRRLATLEQVQARLPADAAFLAWIDERGTGPAAHAVDEHWACLVKPTGRPVWVPLPGRGDGGVWTKDDFALPGQAHLALANGSEPAAVLTSLYRQRLAPLEANLEGVRQLFVCPVGALVGIPIEALAERWTVSYVPSATFLAHLEKATTDRPRDDRLLAVGDPAFGTASYAALPGTRREVTAIAPLFAQATVLLGSDASEQRLDELAARGELKRYRYLHLATHGEVDHRHLLESALVLAQDRLPEATQLTLADRKPIDGRVTAREMLEGWQLDAGLVVLSACQSALGQQTSGEGFVGFSQALLLAGARSVVLSLWSVDDSATALLMTRFYQNLLGKREGLPAPLPKTEALREAKQWLRTLTTDQVAEQLARLPKLERGGERERKLAAVPADKHPYAHPYYWSAFILIGDAH